MIQNFLAGFLAYFEGANVLSKYKLWSHVWLPGLLSLVIAGLVFGSGYLFSDDISNWLINIYPIAWGKSTFEWVIKNMGIGFLITGSVLLFTFKYIILIAAAPFMSSLSEKIEFAMTGKPAPKVTIGDMISDLVRGIRIALRNLIRELLIVIMLTIAGAIFGTMIPVIGGILPAILIFLVQAYFMGFGNLDYTLERKRYGVKDSVRFVRQHKWLAMGNGTAFTLLLFIPIIGWFLAPALGTAAATLEGLKRVE